ncbi:signal peptide peptidase SppA [Bacteroidia bacterium]|nr:signal peptide peptidase SppA [Bacteroidia bacterium]
MKNFFKMTMASCLGVFIAWILVSFLSILIFIGIAASAGSSPVYNLQSNSVLKIDLSGKISERKYPNPFDFLNKSTETTGLNDILSAIKKAKDNDKIKGIYLNASYIATGYATTEPIRKALLDFKESGKFVIAYADNYLQRSYYVCTAADEVFLNPQGVLDFRGLATTIQFNKTILEKWGIQMQVYKVGTYKSAVEPYIQNKMSDANREQVTVFLNDIWGTILSGISESRGISVEQLNKYADECLTFADPQRLVNYKLIDGLKYADEIETYLKEKAGLTKDDKLNFASVKDMESVLETGKKISHDRIAVLYAQGEIIDDVVSEFYAGNYITAQQYVKELNKLKDNDNVKAVVFRVNSPGGSAYASDQIWHAVKELNAVKPVVVSMGDLAASGGYYISCAARKIVAEPTTLTGSIGIFGLIPNGEQLAKRMGATYDGVSTNKHANFGDEMLSIPLLGIGLLPARPFNAEESAMIQAYVERGYDTFLSRCAEGRGKTKAQIDSIGQGRVWTGNQALKIGLVDEIGGINTALKSAAELADITDYSISEYPAKKDFFTTLLEESAGTVHVKVSETILGKELYEQKQLLNAWEHYDYRQAIMPKVVEN